MYNTQYVRRVYVPVAIKNNKMPLPNDVIVLFAIINLFSAGRNLIESYYLSIEEIAREVYSTPTPTSKQCKRIKEGIEKLNFYLDNPLKPAVENNTVFEVDTYIFLNPDYNKYQYGYCYAHDLKKVLKIENTNLFNSAGFYIRFLSTFNSKFDIGHISIEFIGEILHMSSTTVKKHIRRFRKANALYVITRPAKTIDGTHIYRYPNVYYRSGDQDKALEYLDKHATGYYHTQQSQSSLD